MQARPPIPVAEQGLLILRPLMLTVPWCSSRASLFDEFKEDVKERRGQKTDFAYTNFVPSSCECMEINLLDTG